MTDIETSCPFCGELYEITERSIPHGIRRVPVIECANCGAVVTMRRLLRKRTSATEKDIDALIEMWNGRSR